MTHINIMEPIFEHIGWLFEHFWPFFEVFTPQLFEILSKLPELFSVENIKMKTTYVTIKTIKQCFKEYEDFKHWFFV